MANPAVKQKAQTSRLTPARKWQVPQWQQADLARSQWRPTAPAQRGGGMAMANGARCEPAPSVPVGLTQLPPAPNVMAPAMACGENAAGLGFYGTGHDHQHAAVQQVP